MAQSQRVNNSCRLVDYRYVGNKAVGVYAQDTHPVQAEAAKLREETPGKFTKYDLDMGFKFASIPKILYLKMQTLGITDDMPAMVKFLQSHKELTGEDYFTTTKRIL